MRSKFYSQRHNVGQNIHRDKLYIGMLTHLFYTNFGYVWRITAIETSIRGWKRFVKAMKNKLFLDRREVC